ncbi:MAG: NAD-dependent epimerase [bacterium]
MRLLVTGSAGFIGYHLSDRLLREGHEVVSLDNVNDYYDVRLKQARLERLETQAGFQFVKGDLADEGAVRSLVDRGPFDAVIHLAAQAGVRYSLEKPRVYIDSNLIGFFHILEMCREMKIKHLIFASSSSVYGLNTHQPFSVDQPVDHPVSLYGASKKANEVMAHSYASMFGVPCTGLRFFSVYGPWGRPDMALWRFARAIHLGESIDLYNHGDMERDWTYVDDIVEGIVRLIPLEPSVNESWNSDDPSPATSSAPFRVLNIGAGRAVRLQRFLELIEEELGKKAQVNLLPMQPGDVRSTHANIDSLKALTGYQPQVQVEEGIHRTLAWFREYYIESGRPIPVS